MQPCITLAIKWLASENICNSYRSQILWTRFQSLRIVAESHFRVSRAFDSKLLLRIKMRNPKQKLWQRGFQSTRRGLGDHLSRVSLLTWQFDWCEKQSTLQSTCYYIKAFVTLIFETLQSHMYVVTWSNQIILNTQIANW